MTVNAKVGCTRCGEIEESVQRLEGLSSFMLDDLLFNQDSLDIACYRFLVAIEVALGAGWHHHP